MTEPTRARPDADDPVARPGASSSAVWTSETVVSNFGTVQPDGLLWQRLATGDEQALAALFARHRDAVYNYAFRRTASWSVAEDVTQATFTSLWQRARSGRIETLRLESARPLLLAMARDECGNANRTRRRQDALIDRAGSRGGLDRAEAAHVADHWVEAEATPSPEPAPPSATVPTPGHSTVHPTPGVLALGDRAAFETLTVTVSGVEHNPNFGILVDAKVCALDGQTAAVRLGWSAWALATPSGLSSPSLRVGTFGHHVPSVIPDNLVLRPGECAAGVIPFSADEHSSVRRVQFVDPLGDVAIWSGG